MVFCCSSQQRRVQWITHHFQQWNSSYRSVNPRISCSHMAPLVWTCQSSTSIVRSGDGHGGLYGWLQHPAWLMTPQIVTRNAQGHPSSINESTRKLNRPITSITSAPHPSPWRHGMAMAMGPLSSWDVALRRPGPALTVTGTTSPSTSRQKLPSGISRSQEGGER